MIKHLFATALMTLSAAAFAVPFGSQSVLVVENDTGKILLEKNADTVVPIASLTKLMTAMVVLDRTYYVPLWDASWPDDTLVEFTYMVDEPVGMTP